MRKLGVMRNMRNYLGNKSYNANVKEDPKAATQEILGLGPSQAHEKYLGLPSLVGRKKKTTF